MTQPELILKLIEQLITEKEKNIKFQSQLEEFPNARSVESIEALAKFRGTTVNLNAAEAFVLVREIKY